MMMSAPENAMKSTAGVCCTVTVKVQELLFPLASRATLVTVVTPCGNVLPDGGEEVITGLGSQMSEAMTTNVPMAPAGLLHSRMRFVEHEIVGGVVSTTETVNEHVLLLPLESVATQRTVVRPGAKVLPEAGVQTSAVLVSMISEAVTK